MKRTLVTLGLLLLPIVARAQEAPKPQMFLVHEELARPSMIPQYESALRDILAALTEKKADPAVFGMRLYMTPEFRYLYIVPIANYGALDRFNGAWKDIGDAVGKPRWQQLMDRSSAAMESFNEIVVMRRPELSYMPATPRVKDEEEKYVRMEFYYLIPGKEQEAEEVARAYAATFRQKNINDGFTVFTALSGTGLPLLIVTSGGKSAADYAMEDERVGAAAGAELAALRMRAAACTRRYEVREAMPRPEVSYPMQVATK
ncbi:MAG TPA: hypothetical protein VF824_09785 [Thermoanaerobaculia bacterium]|jgi:hypothetical protein